MGRRTMKKLVAVLLPWLASCHAQHINYPYSTIPTAAPTAQTLTAFGIYATPTIIRASDYGVLPGNSATTNDTAFAALNAVLTASPSTVWEVVFAPGTYQYTNNRWLWNVQNIIIDASGVSFQCTNPTVDFNANDAVFNNGDFFITSGKVPFSGSETYTSGYLIDTANAGATSVTITTAANAGNFSVGTQVLIFGYDQQGGGYPPNMRYFEYATVTAVNASTGVVSLAAPLKNFYDSRWEDTANYAGITGLSAGAPRIMSLQRTDFSIPQLIWIRGATLLANPNNTSAINVLLVAQVLIYDYVTSTGLFIVESNQVLVRNSIFNGTGLAPDKLVDWAVIQDTTVHPTILEPTVYSIDDCVGVNDLSLMRDTLYGVIPGCSPRKLTITDTDIIPNTVSTAYSGIATNGQFPVWSVEIGNTRVHNPASAGLSYGFSNVASPGNSFTAGSGSGSGVISVTYSATVASEVDYGMTLTDTTAGISGIVTGIYASGGNLIIDGTWGTISSGDTINFYDVINAYDQGGNVIVGTQVPFWRGPPGPSHK